MFFRAVHFFLTFRHALSLLVCLVCTKGFQYMPISTLHSLIMLLARCDFGLSLTRHSEVNNLIQIYLFQTATRCETSFLSYSMNGVNCRVEYYPGLCNVH